MTKKWTGLVVAHSCFGNLSRPHQSPVRHLAQGRLLFFPIFLRTEIHGQISHCSRFCNCHSTQKPQGSTGIGRHNVNSSIKNTYSLQVSIGFHKSFDLFWEQRVGGSNPLSPTIKSHRNNELKNCQIRTELAFGPIWINLLFLSLTARRASAGAE